MTYKLMENDNTHIENKSRMEHQMFREMALDMTFARLHNSLICLLLKKNYINLYIFLITSYFQRNIIKLVCG